MVEERLWKKLGPEKYDRYDWYAKILAMIILFALFAVMIINYEPHPIQVTCL